MGKAGAVGRYRGRNDRGDGEPSARLGCGGGDVPPKKVGQRAPRDVWTALERDLAANGGVRQTEHLQQRRAKLAESVLLRLRQVP